MQKYVNRFLPYKRKEFDYGFIELSKVDKTLFFIKKNLKGYISVKILNGLKSSIYSCRLNF